MTAKIKTATPTPHIWLDERGRGWIDDTNIKVIEVVLDKLGFGWTPDEIYEGHDHYLSLAQIHAAFVHYYDHKAEYDAEIERQERIVEEMRPKTLNNDPLREKLRAMGEIS
jgi:uncharacterized protein (DUF433 family)